MTNPGHNTVDRAIAEEAFQRTIIEALHMHGWTVAHFRPLQRHDGRYVTPVQGDGAGFPDLVAVRERVLFRELKTMNGRLSDIQQQWGEKLTEAGADWGVWRPSDMERIITEISRGRRF